jgi:hypothetical protein
MLNGQLAQGSLASTPDTRVNFLSTPPQRGDLFSVWCRSHARVSIHAPAKGRRYWRTSSTDHVWFRSTPPQRGDKLTVIHAPAKGRLSSCAGFDPRPRKGATWMPLQHQVTLFRSTPPQRGDRCRYGAVSIHAPAKGRRSAVTSEDREDAPAPEGQQVSIHPRPQRGDSSEGGRPPIDPRPRKGATAYLVTCCCGIANALRCAKLSQSCAAAAVRCCQ